MRQQDFGIAYCPKCPDGSVYWPVLEWRTGYNWEFAVTEYDPVYGEPFCDNGCRLTAADVEDAYPPYEFVTADVDEHGKLMKGEEG